MTSPIRNLPLNNGINRLWLGLTYYRHEAKGSLLLSYRPRFFTATAQISGNGRKGLYLGVFYIFQEILKKFFKKDGQKLVIIVLLC